MTDLDHYDYHLPEDLIAQYALPCRTDARLMIVRREQRKIEHAYIRDLPDLLSPQDCVVLNDTKVVPARLVGYRTRSHGRWQGLFLSSNNAGAWKILSKTRGKLEAGETIMLQDRLLQDVFAIR